MVDVALELYYHPEPSKPERRLGAEPVTLPSRVWLSPTQFQLSRPEADWGS
jgi:hypothetical protein